MAAINELIDKIEDANLRERIRQEVNRLQKQKKFGLVFENHQPESTLLYDIPVRIGDKVVLKNGDHSRIMLIQSINDQGLATLMLKDGSTEQYPVDDLVRIAKFGEPIYPYLQPMDKVENAPDSNLWHCLIQADNYHALQLLAYLYPGQVDCIYIDPPYNTGARDWKYNNDYVDTSDSYRHSKWLSMMEKRLRLAKQILNPKDSVLIVTIDEKEYLHLGCLLEEMFPEARIQMVTSVINPKGNRRDNEFSRCEEYIYFVCLGNCAISSIGEDMLRTISDDNREDKSIRLRALLRGASNHGRRKDRPNLFYPILFDKNDGHFVGCGPVLQLGETRESFKADDNVVAMWPIAQNGEELTWNLQPETLLDKNRKHFLRFSQFDSNKRVGYYLSSGQEENFYKGLYDIIGTDKDGAYILELKDANNNEIRPLTVWNKKIHSASEYGTTFINKIVGSGRFAFPKSLYAVHDTIRFFVANKPNALIVDFFAGSGTTLHAVNLLNAEDGGHRRCIMVTNNEVSDAEAKDLTKRGFKPGDDEWERLGIAQYVNWPRTVCSIEGHDVNGQPLKGDYLGGDKDNPLHMADGFKANATFFKLGFLDKDDVALGYQFKELLPLLWLKAGAKGRCPEDINSDNLPPILFCGNFAVLLDENAFYQFKQELEQTPEIEVVYIITDSNDGYREMSTQINVRETYQLYRDYLDNFRINRAR